MEHEKALRQIYQLSGESLESGSRKLTLIDYISNVYLLCFKGRSTKYSL